MEYTRKDLEAKSNSELLEMQKAEWTIGVIADFRNLLANATGELNRYVAQAAGRPDPKNRSQLHTPPSGVTLTREYWSARTIVKNAKRMLNNMREGDRLEARVIPQQTERIQRAMENLRDTARNPSNRRRRTKPANIAGLRKKQKKPPRSQEGAR